MAFRSDPRGVLTCGDQQNMMYNSLSSENGDPNGTPNGRHHPQQVSASGLQQSEELYKRSVTLVIWYRVRPACFHTDRSGMRGGRAR